MKVSDVLTLAKIRLRNIALSKEEEALMQVIYLGESDLYNRFNLSLKTELIFTSERQPLVEVRSPDILNLVTVLDTDGNELETSDVLGSTKWQWKQINYRSFLLNKPKDGQLIAVYKASPMPIVGTDDRIDLPDAMMEALLRYIVYAVNSTVSSQSSTNYVGRNGGSEATTYFQMYLEECKNLEDMGYKIPWETGRLAIQVKGFV